MENAARNIMAGVQAMETLKIGDTVQVTLDDKSIDHHMETGEVVATEWNAIYEYQDYIVQFPDGDRVPYGAHELTRV